jgi:hypothetical protein
VPDSGGPVLSAAEPQLFVADMPRSLEFYSRDLGFKVGFV